MSQWINKLIKWKEDRNIIKPSGQFASMIDEEVQEYKDATTEHDKIDAIADIIILSVNELQLKGYNVNKVMNEVFKEINSREQNPIQKEQWEKFGTYGKWEKSLLPEHTEKWYKANYESCRL